MKESGKPMSPGMGEGTAIRGVNYWVRIAGREELPVLRPTVMTIARIFSQVAASSSAMADAVARDPFMTARLVRMANSAYYNPGLKKVSAVPRAVVVVGFDAVRHLCVSARFVEETYGGERLQEILHRVVLSYKQALVAQWMGETLRDAVPEELYSAGLLLDLGLLSLLCVVPPETVRRSGKKPPDAPPASCLRWKGKSLGSRRADSPCGWRRSGHWGNSSKGLHRKGKTPTCAPNVCAWLPRSPWPGPLGAMPRKRPRP